MLNPQFQNILNTQLDSPLHSFQLTIILLHILHLTLASPVIKEVTDFTLALYYKVNHLKIDTKW